MTIMFDDDTKKFILNIVFPYLISYLRFTLDFESISKDIQISHSGNKNLGDFFTIGYKPFSPLIGTIIDLSELELEKNASLSKIAKKAEILGANEYYNWDAETKYSWRICIDLENNNRIIYINTQQKLSVGFFNSTIQQLAVSLAIFKKHLYYDESKTIEEEMYNFEEKLKRIDPQALRSKNNLWRILIEWILNDTDEY